MGVRLNGKKSRLVSNSLQCTAREGKMSRSVRCERAGAEAANQEREESHGLLPPAGRRARLRYMQQDPVTVPEEGPE
jgi:hypothetical protein